MPRKSYKLNLEEVGQKFSRPFELNARKYELENMIKANLVKQKKLEIRLASQRKELRLIQQLQQDREGIDS